MKARPRPWKTGFLNILNPLIRIVKEDGRLADAGQSPFPLFLSSEKTYNFLMPFNKKLILAVPYTHALSHISRPLSVAKELRERGHEVVFAGESPKTEFIKAEGFQVLPIHEPDPRVLFGNIRDNRLRFADDEEIERMVEADIALYRDVKPDIVLTDGRFSAFISAQMAGIKHAAIVNVSSTEYRALPYVPFFEWAPRRLAPADGRFRKALDRINLAVEMSVFDNVMGVFKRLSKRCGLKNAVTATNCLTGNDLTLLADVPAYFPARDLPRNYHYVGPLTWKAGLPPPSWWPPQKDGGPLIYVTMGTTGVSDFFHVACSLFRASGFKAILTTGGQAVSREPADGGLYLEPYMDGDLAMAECDLAVCHGGNGTVYQALAHGKPVIGIPTIPDQLYNMRRAEALGIGVMLSWKDFSANPSKLLDVIRSVLRDRTFYVNASRFMAILGARNAPVEAADIICSHLGVQ